MPSGGISGLSCRQMMEGNFPPKSGNGTRSGIDDLPIIVSFKQGDSLAFEALVRKYQDRVHTLCRYMLNNPASFYTWLYRIAVNTCLDHKRRSFLRRWKAW